MPEVVTAQRAGLGADAVARPTEDRLAVTDNAVVLLDGATAPEGTGGWYAGILADALTACLRAEPRADLASLLAESIATVAADHHLRPRHSPSATVAMLRWTDTGVDALVLADSPVVVFTSTGAEVLKDNRLAHLRRAGRLPTQAGADRLRNTAGGFWVAEADPRAAAHAYRRNWPRPYVEAAVLASDGVAAGVDTYRLFDWSQIQTREPAMVLDAVHAAEESDPDRARWPRPKRHDDKTLAVVRFR